MLTDKPILTVGATVWTDLGLTFLETTIDLGFDD